VPALFPKFFVTFFAAEIKRFSIDIHPESLGDRNIGMAVGVLNEILPLDLSFISPAAVDAVRGEEEPLDKEVRQDEGDTNDNDAIHVVLSPGKTVHGAFLPF
jgi:hypothetical protein